MREGPEVNAFNYLIYLLGVETGSYGIVGVVVERESTWMLETNGFE